MKIKELFKKLKMSAADYAKTKGVSTQSAYFLINSNKKVITEKVIKELHEKIKTGVYVIDEPKKILEIKNNVVQFEKTNSKAGRPPKK